jgi:hypothetical protein
MKYSVFNRKSLLFATLLATSFGANAQIHSTHTDEKYNYTTVVYKDKAATDKDVLTALDNSVGMGDVVRVTVAPPKPAATPAVDKAKGEDIWLNHKPVTASGLTAATTPAKVAGLTNLADKTIHTTTIAVPAKAAPVAAPAPSTVAVKPVKVAPAAPKAAPSPVASPSTVEAAPAARKTSVAKTTTTKSGKKVVKKSTRKSGNGYKKTSRKTGKQRYGCPRF